MRGVRKRYCIVRFFGHLNDGMCMENAKHFHSILG